jgi:hypothetical protein
VGETGTAADLIREASGVSETELGWPIKVRLAFEHLLGALAAEPGVAWTAMVEEPTGGSEARLRYRNSLSPIVALLAEGREYVPKGAELAPEVEQMAISAAETIIVGELIAGRAENLPKMLPEILYSLLVPYLGQRGAAAAIYRVREDAAKG